MSSLITPIQPAWFPEEFIFKPEGQCDHGSRTYKVLIGAGTQLWTDPSQILTAQTELYINPDGTYLVRYREFDFNTEVFEKAFTSSYALNDDREEIRFEGLGIGKVFRTQRGRAFLKIQFAEDLHAPLLKGNTVDLYALKTGSTSYSSQPQNCLQ